MKIEGSKERKVFQDNEQVSEPGGWEGVGEG